jgi:UDP-N-acetyl-2-amino-2-deoxyglucuronate dehydrogenase
MKRFGLIGAAGYIAPRHMRAIKDTGNVLVAALDKHDNVGILDSYFPEAHFFTEFERFDRHIDKLNRSGRPLDYVTVCSPNYLHDAHIRFALRSGIACICEKPVVINARNIQPLQEIEFETGQRTSVILQLRLHPAIQELRNRVQSARSDRKFDVDLTYITSRGRWYDTSWKGDVDKSGGVGTNIGVHFFDMLGWVFGNCQHNVVHVLEPRRAAGYLEFERARVRWFMSLERTCIPKSVAAAGKTTFRQMIINGDEFEFSDGFTDLHTRSYEHILNNGGFGLVDALPAIEITSTIRNSVPVGFKGDYHSFLNPQQSPT